MRRVYWSPADARTPAPSAPQPSQPGRAHSRPEVLVVAGVRREVLVVAGVRREVLVVAGLHQHAQCRSIDSVGCEVALLH
eukprot:SAG22_NODE_10311_length_541_cov_7.144796_1_plen_80_part_00